MSQATNEFELDHVNYHEDYIRFHYFNNNSEIIIETDHNIPFNYPFLSTQIKEEGQFYFYYNHNESVLEDMVLVDFGQLGKEWCRLSDLKVL